ncbi:unnamed protein product, partial [marine sediment metagenome]
MIKDEIPTINGDGEYIRDYIYVGDVAQANLLALQNMVKLAKVVQEKERETEKEKITEVEGEKEAKTKTKTEPELKFYGFN